MFFTRCNKLSLRKNFPMHFGQSYINIFVILCRSNFKKFSKYFQRKSHLNFSVCFALWCPRRACLDLKSFPQISQFIDLLQYFICEFFLNKWVNSDLQIGHGTAQKMKFPIKDFFSFLRIWSHLLKKSLTENFIFCTVWVHKNSFFVLHVVSLKQKLNLSLHSLMTFWLFNCLFDEKVKLRRDFDLHSLIFHLHSRSPLMSIFFLTLLKLHQDCGTKFD